MGKWVSYAAAVLSLAAIGMSAFTLLELSSVEGRMAAIEQSQAGIAESLGGVVDIMRRVDARL